MKADPTPYCQQCGKVCPKLPEQSWEQWEALKYCDQRCAGAPLVEDVEWMIRTERGLSEICQRVGRKPATLAKALGRAGRDDLAAVFWRAAA
jgi:hypothetical protein